jgi:hypothetical protein
VYCSSLLQFPCKHGVLFVFNTICFVVVLVLFILCLYIDVQHVRWCSCQVTRRVRPVQQKRPPFPKILDSAQFLLSGSCCLLVGFWIVFCRPRFVLFYILHLYTSTWTLWPSNNSDGFFQILYWSTHIMSVPWYI